MNDDVTVVITSCRRHDLLERTLRSFLAMNDDPVREIVIIEDSDDAGVHAVRDAFPDQPIRVILNGTNIGQLRSVDKAYATVTTPYICHLEDDWEFTVPGVLRRARAALDAEPQAIVTLLRTAADMPPYIRSLRTKSAGSAQYKDVYPEIHHFWYTFTFNPTLLRTADYRALPGGYAGLTTAAGQKGERAVSEHFKAEGRRLLWLLDGGVVHIGHERSNFHPMGKKVRRGITAFGKGETWHKWGQSLRRKFWHMLRRAGVDTEPYESRRRNR